MTKAVKLIKVSDKEFRIGENKITIPESDILFIQSIGDQTDEIANTYYDFYSGLTGAIDGEMNVIVDINDSGRSSTLARKTWHKLSEFEKTGKVALFGLHPVARVLASFVIGFTQKKDIKFFKTKEEAFSWVKE